MNREEFIAAMISELEKQKASQSDQPFFTGGYLNAADVYRKMCFDYPIVDDQALQIFLVGLRTIRVSTKPHDLQQVFQINTKFLDNISYFVDECQCNSAQNVAQKDNKFADSDDEDCGKELDISISQANKNALVMPYNSCKRSRILGQLSSEIFIRFPLFLVKLPKMELSSILSNSLIHHEQHESSESPIIEWRDLLSRYRAFVFKGNSSIICYGNDAKTLSAHGLLDDALSLISSFKRVIDNYTAGIECGISGSSIKNSAEMNMLEYLESQCNLRTQNLLSGATKMIKDDEHSCTELSEQLIAMTKDIWSHIIYQFVDICCQNIDLLESYVPRLLDILLHKGPPSAPEVISGSKLDSSIFRNSKLVVIPTTSEYLGLMVLRNVSNFLTKFADTWKDSSNSSSQNFLQVRNSLRKYLCIGDKLKTINCLCESIQFVGTQDNESHELDLEVASFTLDITELLVFSCESSAGSNGMSAITESIISSRLLVSVLVICRNIFRQLRSGVQPEANSVQIWHLASRCSKAIFLMTITDSSIAEFVIGFPDLMTMMTNSLSTVISMAKDMSLIRSLEMALYLVPILFSITLCCEMTNQDVSTLEVFLDRLPSIFESLQLMQPDRIDKNKNEVGLDDNSEEILLREKTGASHQHQAVKLFKSLSFTINLFGYNEVKSHLMRIEFDPHKGAKRDKAFFTLKDSLRRLYKHINSQRIGLLSEKQNMVTHCDQCTKEIKTLLTMLEGGATSKTD